MTQQIAAAVVAAHQPPDSAFQKLAKAVRDKAPRGRSILDQSATLLEGEGDESPAAILARVRSEGRSARKAMVAAMEAAKAANDALWALVYGAQDAELIANQDGTPSAVRCRAALIGYEGPWPVGADEMEPGDRRALISPDTSLRPEAGMSVQLGGVSWQIVGARELAPAGSLLLYACQVRP